MDADFEGGRGAAGGDSWLAGVGPAQMVAAAGMVLALFVLL